MKSYTIAKLLFLTLALFILLCNIGCNSVKKSFRKEHVLINSTAANSSDSTSVKYMDSLVVREESAEWERETVYAFERDDRPQTTPARMNIRSDGDDRPQLISASILPTTDDRPPTTGTNGDSINFARFLKLASITVREKGRSQVKETTHLQTKDTTGKIESSYANVRSEEKTVSKEKQSKRTPWWLALVGLVALAGVLFYIRVRQHPLR